MKRALAPAALALSACSLYAGESGPGSCEQIRASWVSLIAETSSCERDEDCAVVAAPLSCGDASGVSRGCAEAVSRGRYEEAGGPALEAAYRDADCALGAAGSCNLPRAAACVAGRCRVTEWHVCGGEVSEGCDPVAQRGCAPGEKCAWLLENEDLLLGRTACVPCGADGAGCGARAGEACVSGEGGADDCVAGLHCFQGRCAAICDTGAQDCEDGGCLLVDGAFEDLDEVGLCFGACDPVAQGCPDPDAGCYYLHHRGGGLCLPVADEARGRRQGDPCAETPSGLCRLSGCDRGYDSWLPGDDGSPRRRCAFYCSPSAEHPGGDPAGVPCSYAGPDRPDGPGPGYGCHPLRSFVEGGEDLPAELGICTSQS